MVVFEFFIKLIVTYYDCVQINAQGHCNIYSNIIDGIVYTGINDLISETVKLLPKFYSHGSIWFVNNVYNEAWTFVVY